MRRTTLTLALLICSAALCSAAFAEPNMQPGQWEITSAMDMPGMAFSMPASKHTQCITREDLVPQAQQGNDKCRMLENTTDGDKVTWQVKCESAGGTMTSQGTVVYHGDSFEGTVVTTGSQMPSAMTQKMSGKRIGNCQ